MATFLTKNYRKILNNYNNKNMVESTLNTPTRIVYNKTSGLLYRIHSDKNRQGECSYCNGKRETFDGTEEELGYYKTGFSTSKFRVDDYEDLLNQGWTRCGSYCYIRDMARGCCEVYPYRVDIDKF